jgi:hypothetical protein
MNAAPESAGFVSYNTFEQTAVAHIGHALKDLSLTQSDR